VFALNNYPDNKIGDHTREHIVFLVCLTFLLWFLGLCFLSHWKIHLDSLTVKLYWKNLDAFLFFPFFPLIVAPFVEGQCDDPGLMHTSFLTKCRDVALYLFSILRRPRIVTLCWSYSL
jgi:hypothetical protein